MSCLHQLLQQCAQQEPEYNGGLSSHLPMVLTALSRMGASDARLRQYALDYAQRLSPLTSAPTPAPVPVPQTWQHLRGRIEAYPQLLAYFQQQLKQQPQQHPEQLVRHYLPQLMPGLGGAAFHGLLRLAYAMLNDCPEEIAAALAYFAARYLPLGQCLPQTGQFGSPQQLYQSLAGIDPALPPSGLIFESMESASQLPDFAAQVASVRLDQDTLAALAHAAVNLFLVKANFVALHMVTSCHAVRLLSPYLDDPLEQALPWLWQAHLAAFYAGKLGCQSASGVAALPDSAGTDIGDAQTFATNHAKDDHSIKMVFTCLEEGQIYGDASQLWQQAAQKVCASYG